MKTSKQTTINTSHLVDSYNKKFGAVFTPEAWAKRIVEKHFFKEWLNGATILDPTAGEGIFIEAFISIATSNGITLTNEQLLRLFGIELNHQFVENFFKRVYSKYSINFPKSNFKQGDILFQKKEIRTDFLVGNPPWVNFTDLDENYKEKVKHLFIEYGLVSNQKDLLLGNARTDIASLILLKVLYANLKENGKAIFFLPLSIFQNDGANQEFRNYRTKDIDFMLMRFQTLMEIKYLKMLSEDTVLHNFIETTNKNSLSTIMYLKMVSGHCIKPNRFLAKPIH